MDGNKGFVLCMVVAFVLASAGNSLTFKQMLTAYSSHEFFASQWNVLIYCLMASVVVVAKVLRHGREWLLGQIFVLRQIGLMGAFDCASSLLACFGGAHAAGDVQNILNQALIPMTLALSTCAMGTRYATQQYVGAVVIVAGTVLTIAPPLLSGSPSSNEGSATTAVGVVLYSLSVVPAALSNVYKEVVFKDGSAAHTDVFVLTTLISVVQTGVGVLFLPLLRFDAFGGIPLSQLHSEVVDGFRFFCTAEGATPMLVYCAVNFAFNILQLVITKYCDATILALCTALALPATSLLFAMPLLMGAQAEPFTYATAASLILVILGFLIYSFTRDDHGALATSGAPPGSLMYIPRSYSDPELRRLLDPQDRSPERAFSDVSLRELALRKKMKPTQGKNPLRPLHRHDSLPFEDRPVKPFLARHSTMPSTAAKNDQGKDGAVLHDV